MPNVKTLFRYGSDAHFYRGLGSGSGFFYSFIEKDFKSSAIKKQ